MNLDDVNRGIHKHRRRKRVGRGVGSGHGKTAGRGHKGQGQLAGWTAHPAFEGGRTALFRRIPKRGFHNQFAKVVAEINVGRLGGLFAEGAEVTPAALEPTKLLPTQYDVLKVLGHGELKKKLRVSAHRFSATAAEKIRQAGGEVVLLPGPAPVVRNKQGSARGKKKST